MAECCGDNGTTNIKEDLYTGFGQASRTFRFDLPKSPIPAQIEDAEEFRRFFKTYPDLFIPYAGTSTYTSHSLLAFLISLAELSPTQSGVIQAKKRLAFGGKVKIVRRSDPVFDLGEPTPATTGESKQFFDFLQQIQIYDNGGGLISVRDLAKYQLEDDEASGNVYFELVRTEFMGQRSFKVYTHRPTNIMYFAQEEPRMIAVSPIWTTDYLYRNRPDILPVYPNWIDDGNGSQRTMVHIKNGNYTWYGRPGSIASILDQFLEFQNADYKSKQTATQFTGQALIETEDENPGTSLLNDQDAQDSGFRDTVDRFAKNFTNESSRPQRVLLMSRPYGAKQAFVFQFSPNTQENWFKVTGEEAENNILKAHSFPKHLLGMPTSTGLSNNVYLDVFEIYDVSVNRDIQTEFAANINDIIVKEAAEFYDMPGMSELGVQFQSPFVELLNQRKINGSGNANNSVGGGEV